MKDVIAYQNSIPEHYFLRIKAKLLLGADVYISEEDVKNMKL